MENKREEALAELRAYFAPRGTQARFAREHNINPTWINQLVKHGKGLSKHANVVLIKRLTGIDVSPLFEPEPERPSGKTAKSPAKAYDSSDSGQKRNDGVKTAPQGKGIVANEERKSPAAADVSAKTSARVLAQETAARRYFKGQLVKAFAGLDAAMGTAVRIASGREAPPATLPESGAGGNGGPIDRRVPPKARKHS